MGKELGIEMFPTIADRRSQWLVLPLVLCLMLVAQKSSGRALLQSQQSREKFPPLDDAPVLESDDELLLLSVHVLSKCLGLRAIDSQDMKVFLAQKTGGKVFLSQKTSTDVKSGYFRDASADRASQLTFLVTLAVVLPSSWLEYVAEQIASFIEGRALYQTFENRGVQDITFQIHKIAVGVLEERQLLLPPPSGSTAPENPDAQVNMALLREPLPVAEAGRQYSRGLDLYVRSPTVSFSVNLRQAIKWLVSGVTGTRLLDWFMSEFYAINITRGHYIATFAYYGNASGVDEVILTAEKYIDSQYLTVDLLAMDAVEVKVSLLPQLTLPEPEEWPSISSGHSEIKLSFRVSAPITGVSPQLITTIKTTGAQVIQGNESNWKLKSVAQKGANGPFMVDFSLHTLEGNEVESVRSITNSVRRRDMNILLWDAGLVDVRISARPRLTTFQQVQADGGSGAIASTSGTVIASVLGVLIVVTISAGMLCLVPRGE